MLLSQIKQLFFSFRNGIVADALRKAGMPYKVIFGLQIPQIAQIASTLQPSVELADQLWSDKDVRESRILAAYLFPLEDVTLEKALSIASDLQTREEADMISFRLFKRLPFAAELLSEMEKNPATPKFVINSLSNHLK